VQLSSCTTLGQCSAERPTMPSPSVLLAKDYGAAQDSPGSRTADTAAMMPAARPLSGQRNPFGVRHLAHTAVSRWRKSVSSRRAKQTPLRGPTLPKIFSNLRPIKLERRRARKCCSTYFCSFPPPPRYGHWHRQGTGRHPSNRFCPPCSTLKANPCAVRATWGIALSQ
jgi:hypothetical protein